MAHIKYWWVRGGFLEGIVASELGGQAGAYRKDVKQRRAPVGGVCANPTVEAGIYSTGMGTTSHWVPSGHW